MKKIISSGFTASAALLLFALLCLLLLPRVLPSVAEEYYNPAFVNDNTRNAFYYVQPVALAFALAWFWNRFKDLFNGNWLFRGIEMGFVYLVIATLPGMILIFSAMDVSLTVIGTWLLYGFLQATIAGLIFAKMHV
jgi:hypothetical protein